MLLPTYYWFFILHRNDDFSYRLVDVMGWGTVFYSGPTSTTLEKITLMIIQNEPCQKAYKNYGEVFPSHICTYDYTGNYRDSCQYDSGGPVILRDVRQFLLGTISYGQHCGMKEYSLGINTRTTFYLDWIYKYMRSEVCPISLNTNT